MTKIAQQQFSNYEKALNMENRCSVHETEHQFTVILQFVSMQEEQRKNRFHVKEAFHTSDLKSCPQS